MLLLPSHLWGRLARFGWELSARVVLGEMEFVYVALLASQWAEAVQVEGASIALWGRMSWLYSFVLWVGMLGEEAERPR